jgi:hypothetical protein
MIKVAQKLMALLFFLTLVTTTIPFHHPASAFDAAQWTPVIIPTEGVMLNGCWQTALISAI